MTDEAVSRCPAGRRCRDGEDVRDEHGERVDQLGAIIEGGVLCEVCIRAASTALNHLPDDIKDLRKLLVPSAMRQRLRDPDMPAQPRVKKASPLPFREEVFTLAELIDYEVSI